jgi:hypothetical protein
VDFPAAADGQEAAVHRGAGSFQAVITRFLKIEPVLYIMRQ